MSKEQDTRKQILKERERKKRSYKQNANISKVIGAVLAILVFIDIASWWVEANVDFEMFWYFVVISLICFFYSGFQEGNLNNVNVIELKEENKRLVDNLKDFNATKKYSDDYGLFIAIDDNTNRIAIKLNGEKKITTYSYNDILSCEIIEDGVSIYKKSTTRTVGGAVLGGVIAGGAGAIVGGLSGKQSKEREYKKIQLKLVIKDTKNPNIFLTFFDYQKVDPSKTVEPEKGIKETEFLNGEILKESKLAVNQWKDVFTIIIDKIDTKSVSSSDKKESNSNSSVSDELLKLNELKEKGILTEEEFNEQKKKLLKQ